MSFLVVCCFGGRACHFRKNSSLYFPYLTKAMIYSDDDIIMKKFMHFILLLKTKCKRKCAQKIVEERKVKAKLISLFLHTCSYIQKYLCKLCAGFYFTAWQICENLVLCGSSGDGGGIWCVRLNTRTLLLTSVLLCYITHKCIVIIICLCYMSYTQLKSDSIRVGKSKVKQREKKERETA